MQATYLNHMGLVCALGTEPDGVLKKLLEGSTAGMLSTDTYSPGSAAICGQVTSTLPPLGKKEARFQSRNNRLLLAALQPIRDAVNAAIARYGKTRVAVVLGTSTSGIGEAEDAFVERFKTGSFLPEFHYGQMEISSPSEFLKAELGLEGIAFTLSTACSSSAKALASARRLLATGLCDAVIAGGADMLCRFTVAGFLSLEAVSPTRCNPMSLNRKGINLGEAAALFLMTTREGAVALLGSGETSDAHHISAPEPQGLGAAEAMRLALEDAKLEPMAIEYLNLHGTATLQNDAMESLAVSRIFNRGVACSSTKPLSGHTLGASGALEAAFCWLLLSGANPSGILPPHVYDGVADPALPRLDLVQAGQSMKRPLRFIQSNSFGFGGSNASLVLGRPQ